MDATAAMLLWITCETLLFNAAQDGTAEYAEEHRPEGCYCRAEFDGGLSITLFDCAVMDVAYLAITQGHQDVLMLTAGEDGDIYKHDFILVRRPDPAWLQD